MRAGLVALGCLGGLTGCSTAGVTLPSGGGANFSRLMSDLDFTYTRTADGSVSIRYTNKPSEAADRALAIAESLAATVARSVVPIPLPARPLPERLISPELGAP